MEHTIALIRKSHDFFDIRFFLRFNRLFKVFAYILNNNLFFAYFNAFFVDLAIC